MGIETIVFVKIAVVVLLGVMSPGPDFVVVTRNSLAGGRQTGLWTSVGVAAAIWVHCLYCILGVAVLIQTSEVALHLVRYLGAAYLIYLGGQILKGIRFSKKQSLMVDKVQPKTPWASFREGFLTNALNPKATLFFVAVFTQVIDRGMAMGAQLVYSLEMSIIVGLWFVFVALVFSNQRFLEIYRKINVYIELLLGVILCGFGLSIVF